LGILSLTLCFLLARQNGLHHIAGFGDVGEIDLGTILLLGAGTGGRGRLGPTLKKSTNPLSLACFDRA